jgi:tetratricopeptide (TPR) repeat protein
MKLTLFICVLLICSTATAEVYRWVDEQGRIHYGDKPPETKGNRNSSQKVDRVDIAQMKIFSSVEQRKPIRYSGKYQARLILFEELNIKPGRPGSKDAVVGNHSRTQGNLCSNPEKIIWTQGFRGISMYSVMGDVIGMFKEYDYRMITGNMFSVSKTSSRLNLKAKMVRLRIDICESPKTDLDKSVKEKAAVYLQMSWTLSDRVSGKVLFEGMSEGAVNGYDSFLKDGTGKAMTMAIRMAAGNLLAKPAFIQHLKPTPREMKLLAEAKKNKQERDVSHIVNTAANTDLKQTEQAKTATELFEEALEQKDQGKFDEAHSKLEQALSLANKDDAEYKQIRDELKIELPLAEAKHFLQAHDEARVRTILEPVKDYLQDHPRRLVYMKQIEQMQKSARYLKQSKSVASNEQIDSLKRILKKHYSEQGEYPKNKDELVRLINQYSEFRDVFEVRSYEPDGEKYRLIVYDRKLKQQHIVQDG